MRQLIHSSAPHLIVALDDRAYALLAAKDEADAAVAIELLPTSDCSDEDHKHDSVNEKCDAGSDAPAETKNTVQAVASMRFQDGSGIVCAVSRSDKTLSLHRILTGDKLANTSRPFAVRKLPKRVCCLDLTRVPAANGDEESSADVVITGDLSGDVTAYTAFKSMHETGENFGTSRLLLGHTASMITGVRVVEDSGVKRILSSDRDEKVRISAFPRTFALEGFLLGHSAFIVSLDVALKEGCTRCVTCGGDGTVRLWDYSLCKELANLESFSIKYAPFDGGKEVEIETRVSDQDEKDGPNAADKDVDNVKRRENQVIIPTAAALSYDGSMIAVVRDGLESVDIYAISGSKSKLSFSKKQSVQCRSQPLSAVFLQSGDLCILARNPDFMMQYSPLKDGNGDMKEFSCVTETSSLCSALKSVVDKEVIVMPTTVLEKDQSGQFKLSKDKEKPGFTKHEPWNRIERKEKARNANSRRKKRRKEDTFLG